MLYPPTCNASSPEPGDGRMKVQLLNLLRGSTNVMLVAHAEKYEDRVVPGRDSAISLLVSLNSFFPTIPPNAKGGLGPTGKYAVRAWTEEG
jgi:hypothetical protein